MSTSAEQISELIASNTALKILFDTYFADLEAGKANFDTLSGDLVAVLFDRMNYTATIDPTQPVDAQDNGNYHTIAAALADTPSGATVLLILPEAAVVPFDTNIELAGRVLNFRTANNAAGGAAELQFASFVSNNLNRIYQFTELDSGSITFDNVNISLPDKADAGLAWSPTASCIVRTPSGRGLVDLAMNAATITGFADTSICTGQEAQLVRMALHDVTLDGPFHAMGTAANGIALISNFGVVLQNGAALADGGVIGTNLLIN